MLARSATLTLEFPKQRRQRVRRDFQQAAARALAKVELSRT
jgi:hypothetical protein